MPAWKALALQLWFPTLMFFVVMPVLFPEEHGYQESSWSDFFIKLGGGLTLLALFFIVLVYFRQDTFLYSPQSPEQFPDANDEGFRSPDERRLCFEDVRVTTEDGV